MEFTARHVIEALGYNLDDAWLLDSRLRKRRAKLWGRYFG
jgi:hypothetical protein